MLFWIKELARNKNGCITGLHLYKTTELGEGFLIQNTALKELYAPKLKVNTFTPKSIARAVKLAKLKNGIKNVLHLPQRDLNETDISNFQSLQREF